MAHPARRSSALLLIALILAGCQFVGASPDTGSGQLPTYDSGGFCSLARLLPATVHVDPTADPPTWIEGIDGAPRTNLEWPVGFSLRTVDGVAEVIDPDGIVVARDGGHLRDAGGGASARGDGWFSVCIINGRFYTDSSSQ